MPHEKAKKKLALEIAAIRRTDSIEGSGETGGGQVDEEEAPPDDFQLVQRPRPVAAARRSSAAVSNQHAAAGSAVIVACFQKSRKHGLRARGHSLDICGSLAESPARWNPAQMHVGPEIAIKPTASVGRPTSRPLVPRPS